MYCVIFRYIILVKKLVLFLFSRYIRSTVFPTAQMGDGIVILKK